MAKKKFNNYLRKATFKRDLEAGNILADSISFIKDIRAIYTHGEYYGSGCITSVNSGTGEITAELIPNVFMCSVKFLLLISLSVKACPI